MRRRRQVEASKWDEIGDMLTDKAWTDLGIGDILRFKKNGHDIELKVMRMNKKKRKCYVQQIRTYTLAEVEAAAEQKV